jgi:hypothetical protein
MTRILDGIAFDAIADARLLEQKTPTVADSGGVEMRLYENLEAVSTNTQGY